MKIIFKYLTCLIWTVLIVHKWISIEQNADGIANGINAFTSSLCFWDIGEFFFSNLALNFLLFFKSVFFVSALYGIGRFFLIKTFKFRGNSLEIFIFSSALGYATAGGFFFLTAALKLLYAPVVICILVLFLITGIVSVREYKIRPMSWRKIISRFKGFTSLYKILSLLIIASTSLSFSAIFTPDTSFDPLNYYIAMPNWWLVNHGIADMPSHTYFNLFGFYACIFAPAMAIGGDLMARAINFYAVLPGTLGMAFYLGKKYFGIKTAIMGLALICLTYQYNGLAFTTRSDSMMIMFSLASLATALKIPHCKKSFENLKTQRTNMVVMSAIFAGAAMAVKATSILMVIPIMAIMYYRDSYNQGKIQKDMAKKAVAEMALFIAVASVLVIPWLVKNHIYRGNPFFPFLTGLFGVSDNYDSFFLYLFNKFANFYAGTSLMPLKNLTGIFFLEHINNHFVSPMILLICGFLVFNKFKLRKKHIFLLFFALSSLILQIHSFTMARFFLPTYIVFAMFANHCAKQFIERNFILKRIFVIMLFIAWMPAFSVADFSIIKGKKTHEGYLVQTEHGDFYLYAKFINENLPENCYIINEDYLGRSAFLKKRHYTTSVFDKNFFEIMFSPEDSPEKMLNFLHEKGFTHFLSNRIKYPIFSEITDYRIKTSEKYKNVKEFTSKYLKEIHRSNPNKDGITTIISEIDYSYLDNQKAKTSESQ